MRLPRLCMPCLRQLATAIALWSAVGLWLRRARR